MKKILTLILTSVLILNFAGCSTQTESDTEVNTTPATSAATAEAETILPAVTESVTTTATTVPAKEYPETITVDILLEGQKEPLDMDLFDGGNYVVYVPQDTWTLSSSLENGYLTDWWTCQWAGDLWFQVISFGSMTPAEVEAHFRQLLEPGVMEGKDGEFNIKDPSFKVFTSLSIRSDGKNTFAIMTQMPVEFGDGFGPRFNAILNSFEIKN